MLDKLKALLSGDHTLKQLREKTGVSTLEILEALNELGAYITKDGGWAIPPGDSEDQVDSYLMLQRVGTTRTKERRLLKKLIEQENRRRDGLEILKEKANPITICEKPGHSDATAIFVLSDNHYAEIIKPENTYGLNEHNPQVSQERIISIAQKALEQIKKFRTVQTISHLVIALIGDHIHGDIHEPYVQIHGNELTVLEETSAVCKLLLSVVSFFEGQFESIDVVCVPGNHGRATQKKRENQNEGYSYEQFMFHNLAERASDLGFTAKFHLSSERLQFATIHGKRIRFMHGDDITGGSNVHNSVSRYLDRLDKIPGMQADMTFMGHFHQGVFSSRYVINGCTCGPNLYSLTCGYTPEEPSQALAILTDKGVESVSFISP